MTHRSPPILPFVVRMTPVALLALMVTPARAGRKDDELVIQQLDREIIACQQKLSLYDDLSGACDPTAAPDPIYPELVQAFRGYPIQVTHEGTRSRVTLPASLLFATDEVRLREEGAFSFDLLATALGSHKSHQISVTGYTSSEPPPLSVRKTWSTNLEYSTARATLVGMTFIRSHGIAPTRVTIIGRGDADPVANNDTPEERAQNDRIVIDILPGGTQ